MCRQLTGEGLQAYCLRNSLANVTAGQLESPGSLGSYEMCVGIEPPLLLS